MATRSLVLAGAVVLAVLVTRPQTAHAQASPPSAGAQALLGQPAGTSRFVNLEVRSDEVAATPAERGLLGVSSGLRVRLEAAPARDRRSAAESALLGR